MKLVHCLLFYILFYIPMNVTASEINLENAYQKGIKYLKDDYVIPALNYVEQGGVLKIKDVQGKEKILGPGVFIEHQLYDLFHVLLYAKQLSYKKDDDHLLRIWKFMKKHFDPQKGQWPLWSVEGCLHTIGIRIWNKLGDKALIPSLMNWSLKGALYFNPGWGEGASGYLIQSWGMPEHSLTNRNYYFSKKPNAEMTILYLMALSEIDFPEKEKLTSKNFKWLENYLEEMGMDLDHIDFIGLRVLSLVPRLYVLHPARKNKKLLDKITAFLSSPSSLREFEKNPYAIGNLLEGFYWLKELGQDVKDSVVKDWLNRLVKLQKKDGRWKMDAWEGNSWDIKGKLYIPRLDGASTIYALKGLYFWK